MRKVIYSMGVSLDGYIAGPDGTFDWAAPDEELHRFHNDQIRELGAHLMGRGLYETMVVWETADRDRSRSDFALEFAEIWKALPKVVFSTTLESVVGNTRLLREDPVGELSRLRSEPGQDLAVGGAGLAAELTRRGMIDEYRLFVNPVIAGGGTPFFPPLEEPVDLELIETRTFGSRVIYERYRRV
ncbi:MAG: dihydrofolate reductase family protein [Solirubrobacteraceae bacterium]